MCNCNQPIVKTSLCSSKPKCQPKDCSCPVKDLSTDCVLYTGNNLACSNIESGTILTELIQQLDEFICSALTANQNLSLVNIGPGSGIYRGINLLGERELRTLISSNNSISIFQNTDTIDFVLPPGVIFPGLVNIGSGKQIYKGLDGQGRAEIRTLTSSNNSVIITENANTIDFTVEPVTPTPTTILNIGTGSQLYAGTNGAGAHQIRTITSVDNSATITQTANTVDVSVNPTTTQVISTPTIQVTGSGTSGSPYAPAVVNLQKIISNFPGNAYTLDPNDDQYTIILKNGIDDITVLIPNNLTYAFNVGFIQQGTGSITFAIAPGSGNALRTPITGAFRLAGDNFWAFLERVQSTTEFHLLGNIKV
jgi:hypothetical protein